MARVARLAVRRRRRRQPAREDGEWRRAPVHRRSADARGARRGARWTGSSRRSRAAPARSCSTAWTRTACATATTSSSWRAARERLSSPAGRVRRRRHGEPFRRRVPPGRRLRRAGGERLPLRRARASPTLKRARCAGRASRCGHESHDLAASTSPRAAGLLPAIVQDAATLQVLMLAYMDRAALDETLDSGEATFFSRSRGGRWRKGETSGNRLQRRRDRARLRRRHAAGVGRARWARPATWHDELLRRRRRAGPRPARRAGARRSPARAARRSGRRAGTARLLAEGRQARRPEGRRGGRRDRAGRRRRR